MKVQDITTRVVDKYIQTLQKTPAVNTRTHHAKTEFVTNATIEKITKLLRCAFKQAGRYAIYPQEFLLLQSLVLHWNTAFPDCQLSDPDALDAILRGLRILDYSLHTVSYPIKNTRIPGFVGSAVVEARLALPLLELWNALLSFAPYGGIGIKTTLGMGGVSVEPLVLPQRSL